jgi:hypothetical protein
MPVTESRKQSDIAQARSAASAFINAMDQFRAFKRAYDNLDYFNNLDAEDFTDGVTKAEFISAVGAMDAITTFAIDNNHEDSLFVVR